MDEFKKRYNIFLTNLIRIQRENKEFQGITKFFDLTPKEFEEKYLNTKLANIDTSKYKPAKPTIMDPPSEFNWVTEGAVTPIKNQGMCGGCWAFSAVGVLESLNYIKNQNLIDLSPQQLIDCDMQNFGCNGGWRMF